jgi:hypothetical protein
MLLIVLIPLFKLTYLHLSVYPGPDYKFPPAKQVVFLNLNMQNNYSGLIRFAVGVIYAPSCVIIGRFLTVSGKNSPLGSLGRLLDFSVKNFYDPNHT